MSIQRLQLIVSAAVPALFAKIEGGRIPCESEATLQLHLAHLLNSFGEIALIAHGESFTVELEKRGTVAGPRAAVDIWCCLTDAENQDWNCAIELKFFKHKNHREPNNRYDVFKDLHRLEECGNANSIGYMIVATDHGHYVNQDSFSSDTCDFDFRHQQKYSAGNTLTYRTKKPHGPPITLRNDYEFHWQNQNRNLMYLVTEVASSKI